VPVLFLSVLSLPGAAAPQGPVQRTHDGLEKVPATKVAAAWVKPEVDFSGYDRVMILEVHVAMRKNWQQEQNRGRVTKVSNRDVEQIRKVTATLFREVLVEELASDSGYEVVDEANTNVLLIRPAIVDLDVTAPEGRSAALSRTFTTSAAAATLYLELFDSVSGEILARVVDQRTTDHAGNTFHWNSDAASRSQAREIFAGWAKLLRANLDEVRDVP